MDVSASTVVVVGASAGGVEAVTTVAAGLPADLDAAVCVVLHLRATVESHLAEIVSRAGPLPAALGEDREPLLSSRIYVARPDHHLLVEDGRIVVSCDPPENGFRPSIDTLFRSAASAYGPRTIGVVLSGARDDGVAGAKAIGASDGCLFVQSPAEARFGALPASVVARDDPDDVMPLSEIAPAVVAEVARLSAGAPIGENPP